MYNIANLVYIYNEKLKDVFTTQTTCHPFVVVVVRKRQEKNVHMKFYNNYYLCIFMKELK